MKDKDYKCINGAYHDIMCCPTCWNGHPLAIKGQMFCGTNRQLDVVKYDWINNARASGFTLEQAVFMYENLTS